MKCFRLHAATATTLCTEWQTCGAKNANNADGPQDRLSEPFRMLEAVKVRGPTSLFTSTNCAQNALLWRFSFLFGGQREAPSIRNKFSSTFWAIEVKQLIGMHQVSTFQDSPKATLSKYC